MTTRVMFAILGLGMCLWAVDVSRGQADPLLGDSQKIAAIVPVTGMISDVTLQSLERRVEEAREAGADVIVLEMDTPGGLVTSALEITTYLKQLDLSTVAWVRPDAYSAGAMISIACDTIVMSPRSRIGDSAPIMLSPAGGPAEIGETERAKVESPILEDFRDSARRNGYSPLLVEAMVRLMPAIYMIRHEATGEVRYVRADDLDQYQLTEADAAPPPGEDARPRASESGWFVDKLVNPANTLLTLSQDEAVEFGFARRIIASEKELAAFLGATQIIRLPETWSEQLVNWLTSPAVRSVLMLVVIIGIYMELQSPGLGLPGAAAAVALLIMLGAPYLTGLAGAIDLIIIAIGLALLGVELFVLPGFGVAGVLGLIAILFGLIMTFVPEDPGPGWWPTLPGSTEMLQTGVITVMVTAIVAGGLVALLMRFVGHVPILRSMILQDQQPAVTTAAGTITADAATPAMPSGPAIGATGKVTTGLRPVGRAEFDGRLVEVMARDRWVEPGRMVRVVQIEEGHIIVEAVE